MCLLTPRRTFPAAEGLFSNVASAFWVQRLSSTRDFTLKVVFLWFRNSNPPFLQGLILSRFKESNLALIFHGSVEGVHMFPSVICPNIWKAAVLCRAMLSVLLVRKMLACF